MVSFCTYLYRIVLAVECPQTPVDCNWDKFEKVREKGVMIVSDGRVII
jgi:hypothetical protein